jgi:hypothetical protein
MRRSSRSASFSPSVFGAVGLRDIFCSNETVSIPTRPRRAGATATVYRARRAAVELPLGTNLPPVTLQRMGRSASPADARAVPPGGAASRPIAARGSALLNRRDFFAAIVVRVREKLPAELSGFRHRARSMLLKIDFGNERIHFEVWPDSMRGHVEIGLHFEDGPASTVAYLAFFDSRIVEIKHQLGGHIELERWTVSWGHLFETVPLQRLDRPFAIAVADRLAAQIALLQPMVEEAAVPPERRDEEATKRGRWTRKRRA